MSGTANGSHPRTMHMTYFWRAALKSDQNFAPLLRPRERIHLISSPESKTSLTVYIMNHYLLPIPSIQEFSHQAVLVVCSWFSLGLSYWSNFALSLFTGGSTETHLLAAGGVKHCPCNGWRRLWDDLTASTWQGPRAFCCFL